MTDTNLLLCADRDFNQATPSGLVVEVRTWQLLEIPLGERDYHVVLSEARLRSSHLWKFFKDVQQGILVPPIDLIFPILHLRHAIHVVHRGSDVQPLTADELSFVEEIMSKKFSFPFAKEALGEALR